MHPACNKVAETIMSGIGSPDAGLLREGRRLFGSVEDALSVRHVVRVRPLGGKAHHYPILECHQACNSANVVRNVRRAAVVGRIPNICVDVERKAKAYQVFRWIERRDFHVHDSEGWPKRIYPTDV